MTRLISIVLFIATIFGSSAQSLTSRRDSLVNTAKEVSLWFGPDFNVSDAEAEVKGPMKFTIVDGRPEVQGNDGRDYFEVIFRSNKSSDGSTYLSKVFLWNNGEPFEVLEKARVFDPLGHAGLTPLGKIRLTLAGEIKMTPVEASAGEFFCSFGDPSPGTAGVYLKTLQI